jgi:cytochrome c peroxidase
MTRTLLLMVSLGLSWTWLAQAAAPNDPLLGLPALAASGEAMEAAAARLGKKLFFDTRLSADGKISCGSCHEPDKAFSDGRVRPLGHNGQVGTRNAPSLLNVAYVDALFWDGRASGLQVQARAPLTNPVEHALPSEAAVENIVRTQSEYIEEFQSAFGAQPERITVDLIARALSAYERTLRAGRSAFDRYRYGGEATAMSAAAIRGLALFRGRAQCASCHSIDAKSALFTDGSFHVTPTGLPRDVNANLSALARKVLAAQNSDGDADRAELERLIATDSSIAALGRFLVTRDPRDIGFFKTPSLRNVALTAPYMHDGGVATLEQAVQLELYGRGKAVRYPIVLTTSEQQELIEFLRALTSEPRSF